MELQLIGQQGEREADLTWAALGGEVVADFSLRLKEELGRSRTWLAGYCNDVMPLSRRSAFSRRAGPR